MSSEAFVTLATNDGYALGALVLAQSIRQVGTERSLVVLISNHLSDLIRETLEKTFDKVIVVDELNSNDVENLRLLSRPELGITFTKINCWLLEDYSKCVFLDADCLVLRQIDDLFQREQFSAAPDAGWPDCFNSGVFVYRPSKETFNKLMLFASQESSSFDGGDQGLLNAFFSNWGTDDISRHLPFTYNVTANAFYSYLPAVTRFRNDIHIVHFAGALKPWQLTYNPSNGQLSGNLSGQSDIQRDFILSWWNIMYQRVWPFISQMNKQSNSNNKTVDEEEQFGNGFVYPLYYGNLTDNNGIELGSVAHRRAWEAGHVDYYGRDSFLNIQQQLERNIALRTQLYHPSQQKLITLENTTTTTITTTTGILKNYTKEPTPSLQQQQTITTHSQQPTSTQTTNIDTTSLKQPTTNTYQNGLHQTTPTTTQTENLRKGSFKEGTSEQEQQTTTNHSTPSNNLIKPSSKETTSSAQQKTTNIYQNVLNQPTPVTTNITQTSFKQPAPTVQQQPTPTVQQQPTPTVQQQTTTNISKQPPMSSSNVLQSSLKETTPFPPEQTTTNLSQTTLKQSAPATAIIQTSFKQVTPSAPQQTATNLEQNLFKQSTPPITQTSNVTQTSFKETTPFGQDLKATNLSSNVSKQSTPSAAVGSNVLQTSFKETTPSAQHLTATNLSSNVLKQSTPSAAVGSNVIQTSFKETIPSAQHQMATNLSSNVAKQSAPSAALASNVLQTSFKETTSSAQHHPATNLSSNVFEQSAPPAAVGSNVLQSSFKETTPSAQDLPATNLSSNVYKQGTQSNNVVQSSLKGSIPYSSEGQSTNVSSNILKQGTGVPFQGTHSIPSSFKESPTHLETNSKCGNAQSIIGLIHSNENKIPIPSVEHESNWTVKSTIVTTYTQGEGELAGPTSVSKVVSESTAAASPNTPVKTSIKQIIDSTNSSGLNVTAKTSNDHFAWLFDKLFVAITYTISLCYLLFLVAMRRSKNENIIHGNGTTVQGLTPSTNNGNRVNKDIQ